MCRIDALFSNRNLDEKNDPQERFLQALEEYGIDGYLRELLIKHISENWIDVFSDPPKDGANKSGIWPSLIPHHLI